MSHPTWALLPTVNKPLKPTVVEVTKEINDRGSKPTELSEFHGIEVVNLKAPPNAEGKKW